MTVKEHHVFGNDIVQSGSQNSSRGRCENIAVCQHHWWFAAGALIARLCRIPTTTAADSILSFLYCDEEFYQQYSEILFVLLGGQTRLLQGAGSRSFCRQGGRQKGILQTRQAVSSRYQSGTNGIRSPMRVLRVYYTPLHSSSANDN